MCNTNFTEYISTDNVNSPWSGISDTILSGYSLFIPKLSPKKSYLPKWATPPLRHLLNKVQTLSRLVIRKSYPLELVGKLKDMELSLHLEIQKANSNYDLDLFTNFYNDKSLLFKHLKQNLSTTCSIPNFKSWGSTEESLPTKKCELFIQYFNSVYTTSSSPHLEVSDLPVPTAQISSLSSLKQTSGMNLPC